MAKMVYQWRPGARISLDAQRAGEEIERLRKKANGQLTPAAVVDAARSERHVLHAAFEWDDGLAAESWRADQARTLIASIVVTTSPKGEERSVRAFVNVHKGETRGYTSMSDAMSDAELRKQVVQQALDELRAWRDRYRDYTELAEYFQAIETAKAA